LIDTKTCSGQLLWDNIARLFIIGKYLEKELNKKEPQYIKEIKNKMELAKLYCKLIRTEDKIIIDNIFQEIDKMSLKTDTLDKEPAKKI